MTRLSGKRVPVKLIELSRIKEEGIDDTLVEASGKFMHYRNQVIDRQAFETYYLRQHEVCVLWVHSQEF
jgi:hypothetical protein